MSGDVLALLCWLWLLVVYAIHRMTTVPTHNPWHLFAEVRMTLDDLSAKVTALDAVAQQAVALLGDLKTRLDAALASGDPAKVQAVADAVDATAAALASSIAANTPT